MKCNQCQMFTINGKYTVHEIGCPNDGARWDEDSQDWIKQYKCFYCGFNCDVGENCCIEIEESLH